MVLGHFKSQFRAAAHRILSGCWWVPALLFVLVVNVRRLKTAVLHSILRAHRPAWRPDTAADGARVEALPWESGSSQ